MKRHTYEQEFLGGLIGLAGGAISSLFGGGGGSGGGGGIGGMLKQNDIGGQLISSGIGQLNSAMDAKRDWKYYKKQSALDYEYATKMADYNAQIARDQYDYEYEKESPAARRAQYEAAGLNSALMYGAGGQGMQGSVSSPQGSIPHGSMPHRKSSMEGLVAAAQMRQANTQQAIGESTADRNVAAAELDRERASTERRQQLLKDLEVINQNIKNEHDAQMLDILKRQKEEIIRSIGVENALKESRAYEADERGEYYVQLSKEVRQKVDADYWKWQTNRAMSDILTGKEQRELIDANTKRVQDLWYLDKAQAMKLLQDTINLTLDEFTKRYNNLLRFIGVDPDNHSAVAQLMRELVSLDNNGDLFKALQQNDADGVKKIILGLKNNEW